MAANGSSVILRCTRVALAAAILICTAAIQPRAADEAPAALVEDLSAGWSDIRPFDYLPDGKVLELGNTQWIRLSYFASCAVETITGGVVTVGLYRSEVAGGQVESDWIDCDGGSIELAAGQDQEAGGVVFREGDDPGSVPPPDRVIYDVSPLIKLAAGPTAVVIRRLDAVEEPVSLPAGKPIVDARQHGVRLSLDGTYAFESSSRVLIVKVSRYAVPDSNTAIGRLVPM